MSFVHIEKAVAARLNGEAFGLRMQIVALVRSTLAAPADGALREQIRALQAAERTCLLDDVERLRMVCRVQRAERGAHGLQDAEADAWQPPAPVPGVVPPRGKNPAWQRRTGIAQTERRGWHAAKTVARNNAQMREARR